MTTNQLKTIKRLDRWHLHFSDVWGSPVGYRCERSEILPPSFTPAGYETYEEAERARLEMESYLMRNPSMPTSSKKRKK